MGDKKRLLGTRIKSAREAIPGMTQAALGEALGVEERQVSRWERGENDPGVDRVEQIANLLGKPFSWFYVDSEDENPAVVVALTEIMATVERRLQEHTGRAPSLMLGQAAYDADPKRVEKEKRAAERRKAKEPPPPELDDPFKTR